MLPLSFPCSLPKFCLALPQGRFFAFQPGSSVLEPHDNHSSSSPPGSYSGATGSQLLFLTDGCGVYTLVSPFTGMETLLPVPSGIRVHDEDIIDEEGYWSEEMPVRKLVVCPDSGVFATIVGHELSARVALWKPEADWSWLLTSQDPWRRYADMVFFDGKLYALTNDEDLLALEVGYSEKSGIPRISHVERVINGEGSHYTLKEYTRMRYLVMRPRGGGLLMVCKVMLEYGTTTYEFLLFQADLRSSQWIEVDTLGSDEALFVGRLCSKAVPAGRHDVRGDQVFFVDDSTRKEGLGLPLGDAMANVYDMKDGRITELLRMQPCRDGAMPATWLFREDADTEE
jgi:hypothetical protein